MVLIFRRGCEIKGRGQHPFPIMPPPPIYGRGIENRSSACRLIIGGHFQNLGRYRAFDFNVPGEDDDSDIE